MPPNQSLVQAMRNKPARGLPPDPAPMTPAPGNVYPNGPVGPRARERSPLTDLFPTFQTAHAYFTQISVESSFDPGASPAIYGLRRLRPGVDFGDEFSLFSLEGSALPPDTGGNGIPSGTYEALAWCDSDKTARQAALVVGINLPMEPGTWMQWDACPVPGMHDGESGLRSQQSQSPVLWFGHLPPGSLDTLTTIPSRTFARSWAPFVYRISMGQSLDVGLVVAGAAVPWNTTNSVIVGYAALQLGLGMSTNRQRWGE